MACEPGPLPRAPRLRQWCRCGAPLFAERAGPTLNDWAYVDAEGRRSVWTGPPEFADDPYGYLAHLRGLFYDSARKRVLSGPVADRAAQAYSSLAAALDLGGSVFRHHHLVDTARTERLDPAGWWVPMCCALPMWASPDGWVCRATKARFDYPAESSAEPLTK